MREQLHFQIKAKQAVVKVEKTNNNKKNPKQ